jgi:pilus assembly protein Flp/PilA
MEYGGQVSGAIASGTKKGTYMLKTLFLDESGQSLVEYGILVAVIALVALVGVATFGSNLAALFNNAASSV